MSLNITIKICTCNTKTPTHNTFLVYYFIKLTSQMPLFCQIQLGKVSGVDVTRASLRAFIFGIHVLMARKLFYFPTNFIILSCMLSLSLNTILCHFNHCYDINKHCSLKFQNYIINEL